MDKREFVEKLNDTKRIVIKIESEVISENHSIDESIIDSIAKSVAEISKNRQIAIVSSGAIVCGLNTLSIKSKPTNIVHLQAISSVGQLQLMNIYRNNFEKYGKRVSQVLITADDIQNRRRFINAKNALITLLQWEIIPIINENDTVVVKELKCGGNDNLSLQISNLIEADALIILSNTDDIHTKNPNNSEKIKTKVEACLNAAKVGKLACIANGKKPDILMHLFDGKAKFTFFEPTIDITQSKNAWINKCNPSGVVVIDETTKNSILSNNSLLPSGIKKVYGTFDRGDIINIEDENGCLVAKGITNYDSSEIERIKGCSSDEIIEILGYRYSNDVVNIDNMVIKMQTERQIKE